MKMMIRKRTKTKNRPYLDMLIYTGMAFFNYTSATKNISPAFGNNPSDLPSK